MFSYETNQQHNNAHESLEIWIKIKSPSIEKSALRKKPLRYHEHPNKLDCITQQIISFSIFRLIPEKIYFKVGQNKIALSRAGNSQEKDISNSIKASHNCVH